MSGIKITTPSEMKADLSQLEKAVELFEKQWKIQSKGEKYYHLVIECELNREVCKEVEKLYRENGWTSAECKTSSENGERYGLTGLQLRIS